MDFHWILKIGFQNPILKGWILKNRILGHPSLGNPGFEVLEIQVLRRYPSKSILGAEKSWFPESKKDAQRNYELDGPILSP